MVSSGASGEGGVYKMNRIFSVVRSMTEKIIELSRGVVTAPTMGKVTAESESISSTCRW